MTPNIVTVSIVFACNANYFELRGLPTDVLNRIQRFVGGVNAIVEDDSFKKIFRLSCFRYRGWCVELYRELKF